QGRYRLVTTLTDHRADPAGRLIRPYHERWEIESAYLALRHTLLTGTVLRSGDPAGPGQEMWAALTLYQVRPRAMTDALAPRPGTDPDRACFTTALEAAREQVITAHAILPGPGDIDLLGAIGRAVLAGLLPARRRRLSIRKVKSPTSRSRSHTHRAGDRPPGQHHHHRPAVPHPPRPHRTTTPPQAPRPPRSWALARHLPDTTRPAPRSAKTPTRRRAGRKERVLALLQAEPARSWHSRETGQLPDVPDLHSFGAQMSQWA